ncbi:MAG: hypothetical protein AAGC93_29145, partial [Cyanobacteria bacterium P01_F01_bin.53]
IGIHGGGFTGGSKSGASWVANMEVLLGVSIVPFLLNVLSSWILGKKAPPNPWQAIGLEWLVPSPPPHENFDVMPVIVSAPYGYGEDKPLVEPELLAIAGGAASGVTNGSNNGSNNGFTNGALFDTPENDN